MLCTSYKFTLCVNLVVSPDDSKSVDKSKGETLFAEEAEEVACYVVCAFGDKLVRVGVA